MHYVWKTGATLCSLLFRFLLFALSQSTKKATANNLKFGPIHTLWFRQIGEDNLDFRSVLMINILVQHLVTQASGWHSGALGDILALWVTFWRSGWHSGALGDILALWVTFWLSGWHSGALGDILALWVTFWRSGWHSGALGDILALWVRFGLLAVTCTLVEVSLILQVTSYSHRDANNLWIIKPREPIDGEEVMLVKSGDLVRLQHKQ